MPTRLWIAATLSLASAVALAGEANKDSDYDKSATSAKDYSQQTQPLDERIQKPSDQGRYTAQEQAANPKGMEPKATHPATLTRLDTDRDTKISRQEFDRYFGTSPGVQRLDANRNGMIDEDELEASQWDVDFDELDSDHDGKLPRSEFQDELFTRLDKNHNQRLDEDEWDDARDTGFFDM